MSKIIIGTMGIEEAKKIQDDLAQQDINIYLDHNPTTCTRGCSVTVEVACDETSISNVAEYFQKNFKNMAQDQMVNWELMNEVFDPNQEMATCPACGTKFRTTNTECPECGLCFA